MDVYEEEGRKEIYERSIRQGMLKQSFDTLLNSVAHPIAQGLKPLLQKLHPDIDFLDPIIESGLELATLHVVAEIVQASAAIAHKIPGLDLDEDEALDKTDAIARAMRGYSGDRIGDKAAKVSVMLLPMVKQFVSNASLAGIFNSKSAPKALNPATEKVSITDLLEKEENEEGDK